MVSRDTVYHNRRVRFTTYPPLDVRFIRCADNDRVNTRGSILNQIGTTPLVPLTALSASLPVPILGKCEFLNPALHCRKRHECGQSSDRSRSYRTSRIYRFYQTERNASFPAESAL
jgi:hypothetical protein